MSKYISKRSRDFSFWTNARPDRNHKNEPLEYSLRILDKDTSLALKLTHNEWQHLLTFLRQTTNKKNIPTDKIGFRGFNIDTNKPEYYSRDLNYASFNLLNTIFAPEDERSKKAEELVKARLTEKDVKKIGLDVSVFVRKGDVEIYFKRTHFLRFRIFCLSIE